MKRMIAFLLVVLPLPATAQGPGFGATLAEHWCMGCHIVESAPKGASANGVPSFPSIAAKPTTTPQHLNAYLSTGHTHARLLPQQSGAPGPGRIHPEPFADPQAHDRSWAAAWASGVAPVRLTLVASRASWVASSV